MQATETLSRRMKLFLIVLRKLLFISIAEASSNYLPEVDTIHAEQFSDVSLNCNVQMTDNCRWMYNNVTITFAEDFTLIYPEGKIQLLHNYSLFIRYADFEDEGIYWCLCAHTTRKSFQLTVKGEIPYGGLTCEEIEQEIRKMRNLDQPLTCPGGIYSMMLASWDTSVDERPDLSEWKQKLVCLLQSAKKDSDDTGDRSYFTLEDNSGDYEDDYIDK